MGSDPYGDNSNFQHISIIRTSKEHFLLHQLNCWHSNFCSASIDCSLYFIFPLCYFLLPKSLSFHLFLLLQTFIYLLIYLYHFVWPFNKFNFFLGFIYLHLFIVAFSDFSFLLVLILGNCLRQRKAQFIYLF